jgi:hypothetical protein
MNRRQATGIAAGTLVLLSAVVLLPAGSNAQTASANKSVEGARREVRLLDDVYKSAIVLITKNYVDEKSSLPAGKAFKVLFKNMKDKGWHEVRLLDGLGEPLNDENKPRDDFERKAVKQIMAGKPYYEELATKDGKQYLRAATVLPMAMEKCTMCHDNFQGKKVVGALSYTLPLDEKAPVR